MHPSTRRHALLIGAALCASVAAQGTLHLLDGGSKDVVAVVASGNAPAKARPARCKAQGECQVQLKLTKTLTAPTGDGSVAKLRDR